MTDYLKRGPDHRDPRRASALDELSFWSSRFGALLFENLDLAPGLRVLDLGCGTGFPLLELAQRLGGGSQVAGVDIWKEGLERAARKLDTLGLRSAALVRADGRRLPFPDGGFDLIVSNLGINNFETPEEVFAECRRVSKPGARLALTTNVIGHMAEFYTAFRQTLTDLGLARYLGRLEANEAHRGSTETVRALLEGAAFRVTKTVSGSFRMRYLDGSAFLRHELTKLGFLDGWRAVVDPADEEPVFAALEKRLNGIAKGMGSLTLSVPMRYIEAQRL
jgi:arsenite methyltransferase